MFFLVILFSVFGASNAYSDDVVLCSDKNPPKQALESGKIKLLFSYCPNVKDVSMSRDSTHMLYSGQWYQKAKPPASLYSQSSDGLNISLGGSISTVDMNSMPGLLPVLPGKSGFYIEFIARIDNDSKDHWPALWLNPIEHNSKEDDRSFSQDKSYQHWMELDVDEGGFQDGMFGTVIDWQGNYPDYTKKQNSHPAPKSLDRTKFHLFSAYYNPVENSVTWWVDGEFHNKANAPVVGAKYSYYVIFSAQSHGLNEPYKLIIKRIRAFVAK